MPAWHRLLGVFAAAAATGCLALPDTPFDNPCDPAHGAEEVPYNGIDDDCDPDTPDDDLDGDGVALSDDCDDNDDRRAPDQSDACPADGIDNDCSGSPDDGGGCWLVVPTGVYRLGQGLAGSADPWAPAHAVELSAFAIAAFETTNGQVLAAGSADVDRATPEGLPTDYATHRDYARHPAVGLSHADAAALCAAAGGRLPSEAEWEAAAGGRIGHPPHTYPWRGALPDCEHARFADCEVGPLPASALPRGCTGGDDDPGTGACHLAGNVREWVADRYAADAYAALAAAQPPLLDPAGPDEGSLRVVRGGSWRSPAQGVTTWFREGVEPAGHDDVGFRCVRAEAEP